MSRFESRIREEQPGAQRAKDNGQTHFDMYESEGGGEHGRISGLISHLFFQATHIFFLPIQLGK